MSRRRAPRTAAVVVLLAFGMVAAACAPQAPGGGPAPINWSFRGLSMSNQNSTDGDPGLFGVCWSAFGCNDEPYIMNINFKVTIGQPGSAVAWRTGSGDYYYNDVAPGESHTLVGNEQATATFTGIKPLDLLDALNPSNKMDIVGTYTWAMEEDGIHYDGAASDFAEIMEDALNATLAASVLPTEEDELVQLILDLIFNNIGNVFSLLLANLPVFGFGDDTLGGAVYIGIGATGALGGAINAVLGGFSVPAMPLLGDNLLPPDIDGGGIYTMTTTKNFTQVFTGADGQHTYDFQAAPA